MRELTRDMQTKCDYSDRKDPKHKVMVENIPQSPLKSKGTKKRKNKGTKEPGTLQSGSGRG